ncbi:hypothetical protein C1I98_25150 [Spongiactinospora gelatinilytica]|uniref:Uncharacterized protein n=1 Tax=Spongiactinospora gelatinilytica TaxID=2666298 RepID=A0A2W2GTJ9_9ACTN|nr:hypothetical protein [Spongiactinospora gelatinilytica]PZG37527.1 hypothetical protein C1I98_25150 [Spongiactinospora gelatinilytica]
MDASVAARIERLIDDIGDISTPVKRALRAVPRHQFIAPVGLVADDTTTIIDRDTDPATWLDAIYSRLPIVTQLDDGATDLRAEAGGLYTSSNSAPGTVTDACFRWLDWGEPSRYRPRMTVTSDGQQVWLDTPQQAIG